MKGIRAFLMVGCALLGGRAAGDAPADGAPVGMVSFFGGLGCPTGWVPASAAQGRLIVAVSDAQAAGMTVGEPLGDLEDRTHVHMFQGNLPLQSKSISAADGGNQSAAGAQTYSWASVDAAAPSGLPFMQLLVCERK